jgi:hypothetical protein
LNDEHRKSVRRRALKGGLIVFDGGYQSLSCTIRDLSEGGARLKVESVFGIPSTFTLTFTDGSPSRDCVVKWKNATALGVEFKTGE